jgi:alkylhydroperoxidase family enzyme
MARVPYVTIDQLGIEDKPLMSRPHFHLQQALANHPSAFRQFAHIGLWFRNEGELPARLREMCILAVAYALGSGYEFSHHLKVSKDYGVTTADVNALIDEHKGIPSTLTAHERVALEAARQLTIDGEIGQSTWDEVASGLNTKQCVEFVLLISFYNHFARVMAGLKVELETEYELLLSAYTPPPGYDDWK